MKRDNSISWDRVAVANFDGLNVAVVGGTGGIGPALSRFMAERGANVTVVGQTFRDQGVDRISFLKADLSLMREAKRVGEELPAETLDLVVFTTGIMAGPQREETAEGIERDVAISYLSRLVVLRGIGARLGKDRPAAGTKPRVFVMGFPGNNQIGDVSNLNSEGSYSRWTAHMNTVAGNEALVLDAAHRYPNINVFGLNPGFVKTNIRGNLFGSKRLLRVMEWATSAMTTSPDGYAARVAPLMLSPSLEGHSGAMFNNKAEAILPSSKISAQDVRNFMAASGVLARKAGITLPS